MNALTTATATVSVSIGTKKAPLALHISRDGAALAAGRIGNDARKAERGDLATQARNGAYWKASGFLLASLPAVAKIFGKAQERQRELAELFEGTVELTEAQQAKLKMATAGANCREGFSLLVQLILNWKAERVAAGKGITKAQAEAIAVAERYVELSALAEAIRTETTEA